MKKLIRDLIIGGNNFIESRCEFSQVMLSGQFIIIALICSIASLALDLFLVKTLVTLPLFSIFIALFFVAWHQHRKGLHDQANHILFPTMIILVYLIAAREPLNFGTYIYFIPIALGSFAVFDYKKRMVAIGYASLAYIAFILVVFSDFSVLPDQPSTDELSQLNLIFNFSFAFPASILAILLLIQLNHKNTVDLMENNKLLKKTNEELDRFVYSTSHDLRAPLASLLGLLHLAENSNDLREVNHYMGLMKNRVKSLDVFIKEITDFSRNNRVVITREKIKLSEFVMAIWENLRYAPDALNIDFQLDIPEGLEVETDRNRMHIVLSNLISNAIHYHDKRKANRYIRVTFHETPRSFCITVEDNGQGIIPEYQRKIFEMFFRGNETSQGSGLGLYIVQEIIMKLSGSIELDSAPQRGSSFKISLPQ